MSKPGSGRCPECGEVVELDLNAEVGDRMYCPGCDVELTVVKLKPPKFKAVEEFEDDDDEESVHEVEEDDDWQDDDDLKEDEY